MRGASHKLILGALTVGLALFRCEAVQAADDAVLRGPTAAIAKARAAAAKAEERAQTTNAQSATTLGDSVPPPGRAQEQTGPSSAGDAAAEPGKTAEAASQETASYDPTAHRDPFLPMLLKGVTAARTPLETYQLGQLKLVGIVAQPEAGYRAMVEDSSGLGYIITTGTPIGSSGGVVRSIEPRRVVIEESTHDFYGDVKPKEVVMELPQEDRSP